MSKEPVILVPNNNFHRIYKSCKEAIPRIEERTFLALDPGETTGYANWDGSSILLRQWDTKDRAAGFRLLDDDLRRQGDVMHLRMEDYRVYSFKADQHHFTELHTAKLIGAFEVAALLNGVPISMMMAQQAKAFWTDEKLKLVGLYEPGMKHARDALRHLLYLICFGKKGG